LGACVGVGFPVSKQGVLAPHRGAAAVVWVATMVACAGRVPPVSPALLAEVSAGDALVREGCYQCLERALATYERVAETPQAPSTARRGAFDTAILLAVRAKELGIPPERFLSRARHHTTLLPPPTAPEPPPEVYLEAAELFVGEMSGFDPDIRQQRSERLRRAAAPETPRPPARLALAQASPTDLPAAYLALAVDCEEARARRDVNAAAVLERHGDSPLIRFRLALCAVGGRTPGALREADARWLDALVFEGRAELSRRAAADVGKAVELFASAHAAFPESLAITLALGNAQNMLSEYEAALANFDGVLAQTPTHREAGLGRTMSLSYLSRHIEAIAEATRLIDLGTWLIGDAYYWRAWNRFQLKELETAWADIEEASKLNVDTSVFTLAGFIAYARKELDVAVNRFERAFALDATNCEAVWTAGLVRVDQRGWGDAASKFSRGMTCFVSAAAQAEREIAEIERATSAEALKAKRIAAAQKRIETSRFRGAQSAFNAAQCYLRLGQKVLALTHVDAAAEHEQLKDKAVSLRATIEKLPH
jgi:tetratricopeptide (TPR) repeat protein